MSFTSTCVTLVARAPTRSEVRVTRDDQPVATSAAPRIGRLVRPAPGGWHWPGGHRAAVAPACLGKDDLRL